MTFQIHQLFSRENKGGVCYFLWEKDFSGECEMTNNKDNNTLKRPLIENNLNFLRYNQSISIVRKVLKFNEEKIDNLISQ